MLVNIKKLFFLIFNLLCKMAMQNKDQQTTVHGPNLIHDSFMCSLWMKIFSTFSKDYKKKKINDTNHMWPQKPKIFTVISIAKRMGRMEWKSTVKFEHCTWSDTVFWRKTMISWVHVYAINPTAITTFFKRGTAIKPVVEIKWNHKWILS